LNQKSIKKKEMKIKENKNKREGRKNNTTVLVISILAVLPEAALLNTDFSLTTSTACSKKSFTMVFQMLLCGECKALKGGLFVHI
jgi:hypothetical protein